MHEPLAEAKIHESIHGDGTLRRGSFELPVASFSLERTKHDHASPWLFTGYVATDHREGWDDLLRIGPHPIEFVGRTDSQRPITIPRVQPQQQIAGRLSAEVREWYLDPGRPQQQPSKQYLIMSLTATPLALPEVDSVVLDWTGEIKAIGKSPPPPAVLWGTSFGQVRFSKRYSYESVPVNGVKSTLQIPVPAFYIQLDDGRPGQEPLSLMREFDVEAEDALRVISFLSRRHVRSFHVIVSSRWQVNGGTMDFHECEWYRSTGGKTVTQEVYPLVNPRRLPPDALGRMIACYQALSFKASAASAIVYLIEAYHANFVDSQLANAFTGLEALVSGFGDANRVNTTLGSSQFSALQTRLKETITSFAKERGIEDQRASEIIEKIPELRRRAIVNQVVDLVENLGVEWRDLWPPQTVLKTAIREAYGRRNRFVHAGQLHSVRQAHVDATRIQVLAERILLALLGGDPQWHDFRSFEHIEGLSLIESHQV